MKKKIVRSLLALLLVLLLTPVVYYNLGQYRLAAALSDNSSLQIDSELVNDSNRVRLTLVTYNVWALPMPVIGMERVQRIPHIPQALAQHRPDVVTLQEVFDPSSRQYIAGKLASLQSATDPDCIREFPWFGQGDCFGGLLTFSRLPILKAEFHQHQLDAETAKWDEVSGEKGLTLTTIDTAVGPVTVVNVHLYAGREPQDEAFRLQQLKDLESLLNSEEYRQQPILLAGDLNVFHPGLTELGLSGAESEAYRYLVESMNFIDSNPTPTLDHLSYDIETNRYANIWLNRFENRQLFDYVMYRVPAGFEVTLHSFQRIMDGAEPLSDHFGLSVDIELVKQF